MPKRNSISYKGETYFTATGAARFLSVTRNIFYNNVQKSLTKCRVGALKAWHYKQSELEKFLGVREAETA